MHTSTTTLEAVSIACGVFGTSVKSLCRDGLGVRTCMLADGARRVLVRCESGGVCETDVGVMRV